MKLVLSIDEQDITAEISDDAIKASTKPTDELAIALFRNYIEASTFYAIQAIREKLQQVRKEESK